MTQQKSVQTILVIETEAVIGLDVAHVVRRAGVEVAMSDSVAEARKLIEAAGGRPLLLVRALRLAKALYASTLNTLNPVRALHRI